MAFVPRPAKARGAIHPMQAMLNFATAIVTARLMRAIIARGMDASFGFLHDGRKPGRLSLVWDAVEPHRPKLVRTVFEMAASERSSDTISASLPMMALGYCRHLREK